MTMPSHTHSLGKGLPSSDEQAAAAQLRQIIAAYQNEDATLKVLEPGKPTSNPTEITLTPGLSQLLLEVLRFISKGDAVTLVPVSKMLTTQQAADILNVSRPYLIKLLESEKIKFEKVGRHRRIKAEDLYTYKEQRDQQRDKALSALAETDVDLI